MCFPVLLRVLLLLFALIVFDLSLVFLIKYQYQYQYHLPEPKRAFLVGVYAFLIWNNLCDLVYQTPSKSYQSQIPVAVGIPDHVTTKHLPDTPC